MASAGDRASKNQGVNALRSHRRGTVKSLGFASDYGHTRLRCGCIRGETGSRNKTAIQKDNNRDRENHRGDEVTSSSISYLPATFTTLFILAASLLLGLM
jgi:hypothetical protein